MVLQNTTRKETNGHGMDTIILLHGIGCNSWMNWFFASHLRSQGYLVHNLGYNSVGQSLPSIIERMGARALQIHEQLPEGSHLHLVGHSMGAIISRAMASQLDLPQLKRIVMITPPNAGSHVATYLGPKLRWLSPAVLDLADHPDSFVNRLPVPSDVELGVIAAERDPVVREESTHIKGESDHIILPGRHGELVFKRDVYDQVIHFLQHGGFHRAECMVCEKKQPEAEQVGLQAC